MTAPEFLPSHVVPPEGMATWTAPDTTRPTAPLDPLLPVQIIERRGDWARALCSNGWSAWVDGRLLLSVPHEPPAAAQPAARTADPRPLLGARGERTEPLPAADRGAGRRPAGRRVLHPAHPGHPAGSRRGRRCGLALRRTARAVVLLRRGVVADVRGDGGAVVAVRGAARSRDGPRGTGRAGSGGGSAGPLGRRSPRTGTGPRGAGPPGRAGPAPPPDPGRTRALRPRRAAAPAAEPRG